MGEKFVTDKNLVAIAKNNCLSEMELPPAFPNDTLYCPKVFDGYTCWNDTLAGQIAYNTCPEYVIGFDPQLTAYKVCLPDGNWFKHPETNVTWSNYSTCIDWNDLMLRETIDTLYIIGYSISIAALLLSVLIFIWFKSLRCTRIIIHINLFFSFIINNSMWIIWYTNVIYKPDVIEENKIPCRVLHILLQYFLVCNYFWMFCEGLYLHTLLVVTFINEREIVKWLYVIGWGLPAPLTIIYSVSRWLLPTDEIKCWMDNSPFLLILLVPICISMGVNFIFLINIIRILITKLRTVNSTDINQTRKAVRATFILIPLLGLHYLVIPFRPDPKDPGEDIYQYVSAIVTSFQGFCVACLFCFFNEEIQSLLGNKLLLCRGRRRSYTGQETSDSHSTKIFSKIANLSQEEQL